MKFGDWICLSKMGRVFEFFRQIVSSLDDCDDGGLKMVFRILVQILVAPKYGDVSQRHLCNVPKIFCRRHFGFEIGEHEAKHELHGISEKIN